MSSILQLGPRETLFKCQFLSYRALGTVFIHEFASLLPIRFRCSNYRHATLSRIIWSHCWAHVDHAATQHSWWTADLFQIPVRCEHVTNCPCISAGILKAINSENTSAISCQIWLTFQSSEKLRDYPSVFSQFLKLSLSAFILVPPVHIADALFGVYFRQLFFSNRFSSRFHVIDLLAHRSSQHYFSMFILNKSGISAQFLCPSSDLARVWTLQYININTSLKYLCPIAFHSRAY